MKLHIEFVGNVLTGGFAWIVNEAGVKVAEFMGYIAGEYIRDFAKAIDMEIKQTPLCSFPSSVTGARCVLPKGHVPDSPTRFHRFPPQGEDSGHKAPSSDR